MTQGTRAPSPQGNARTETAQGRESARYTRTHRFRAALPEVGPRTGAGYYHHAALRTRIRRITGTWYCQLEPDYCFTSDGYTESRYADSLLTGIKKLDRHAAVASWTKMWARYLRGDDDLFNSGRQLRFGDLLAVTVDRGIDDKWWSAAPDDEPGDSPSDRAAADLAAAGIDTDVLAL